VVPKVFFPSENERGMIRRSEGSPVRGRGRGLRQVHSAVEGPVLRLKEGTKVKQKGGKADKKLPWRMSAKITSKNGGAACRAVDKENI